jgi:hypothetical protein
MEEMISEKKEREDGSSSCSNSATKLVKVKLSSTMWQLTLRVFVAQGLLSHVCQLDRALA